MPSAKTRVPAIDGWFTLDDDAPTLLGSRCTSCGTYAFPKETFFCRNPGCQGKEFAEAPLSRRGTGAGHPLRGRRARVHRLEVEAGQRRLRGVRCLTTSGSLCWERACTRGVNGDVTSSSTAW